MDSPPVARSHTPHPHLATIMPLFEYLPNEIIREIPASLNLRHLQELSRVSRFFNPITESSLYASLGNRRGRLTPTLRTLVARPDLTRHVRRVCLSLWRREIPPDSEDSDRFSAIARQRGLKIPWSPETQPWTNADQPWAREVLALLHESKHTWSGDRQVPCYGQLPYRHIDEPDRSNSST